MVSRCCTWIVDEFVRAELGAAMPQAGGSFVFLRETFGRDRRGVLDVISLHLVDCYPSAACGSIRPPIGFVMYFHFLVRTSLQSKRSPVDSSCHHCSSIVKGDIGKISVARRMGCRPGYYGWLDMWWSLLILIPRLYLPISRIRLTFSWVLTFPGYVRTVKTVYSYLGYYNVCHLGGEIRNPERISLEVFFYPSSELPFYLSLNLVFMVRAMAGNPEFPFIVSTFIE
ncbi:MAG: hypothetical protein IPM69_12030 [Ignavibacteria bacterium]|nr:hypothetical protein [Ignavibacteria bacterium]